jgi:GntR family transcriptional regulator
MLNRLRFLDGKPEVLVVTYLLESKCPGLVQEDLSNNSLYELLARKYGLVISQGYRTVEAIALERPDAKQLGVPPGSPALLLKSVGMLEDGTPLEYYMAKHRGDRSKFHIYLVRDAKSYGRV